ncbi:Hypothetical protein NTJ_00669 [Nesidiocoris tenuis]|uniref:Uncharacterized protein n=1 Tax=Nesidiocoris tenuis TaxID=355587 RepID=A0ABN7A7E5_9HEMI|nr:Hypothetical protein NTJ_00669 [Nesidiocoris tenuis]
MARNRRPSQASSCSQSSPSFLPVGSEGYKEASRTRDDGIPPSLHSPFQRHLLEPILSSQDCRHLSLEPSRKKGTRDNELQSLADWRQSRALLPSLDRSQGTSQLNRSV